MTDVAEIARGLTKAQRRAICALNGETFTHWNRVYRQRRQRIAMHALNLHEPDRSGAITIWSNIRLTPLGLAVRAHLTQEQPR